MIGFTVTAPFDWPGQITWDISKLIAKSLIVDKSIDFDTEQPLSSVTVTEYSCGNKLVIVSVVSPVFHI